jgi:hypothetical protein
MVSYSDIDEFEIKHPKFFLSFILVTSIFMIFKLVQSNSELLTIPLCR